MPTFALLIKRIEDMAPEGAALERALHRIGTLFEAKVKENIVSKGLVGDGNLLNSVKYKVVMLSDGGTVTIGSYGVKYARAMEFGATIRPVFVRKLAIPVSARAKKEAKQGVGPGSYGSDSHPDQSRWNPQYYRVGDTLRDIDTNMLHWVLRDEVKVAGGEGKGYRYMSESLEQMTPHVLRILSQIGEVTQI